MEKQPWKNYQHLKEAETLLKKTNNRLSKRVLVAIKSFQADNANASNEFGKKQIRIIWDKINK